MSTYKWIGKPLKRREDRRFIVGRGSYVDDLRLPNMAYVAFVRSPYAHAIIKRIDVSASLRLPGVIYVLTGEELSRITEPMGESDWLGEPASRIKDYMMAVGRVRYDGEPVAAVVADSPYLARDAAELVEVEYEPLPAVIDPIEAMKQGATVLHEEVGSNVVWHRRFVFGDVESAFRDSDRVISERFHFHRFTSAPLETNAVIANYDESTGRLTVWSNNQRPAYCAPFILKSLKIPQEKIRMIVPDVGGGFGIKTQNYPYIGILALLSMIVKRPVKWVEDRQEHLKASTHGNEVICDVDVGFKSDGTLKALRVKVVADEGAYLRREPLGVLNMITRTSTLTYKFKAFEADVYCVLTNKCPVGPNRSYGKMQQAWIVERVIDRVARNLGMDPAEVRMKNLVQPSEMPYTTPTGAVRDGGDYPAMLRKAMEAIDYWGLRKLQRELREKGRYIGIGIGFGMDSNPVNVSIFRLVNPEAGISGDAEAAMVEVNESGGIIAATGSVPQGQGHETTIAQVVAEELGVTPDDVVVLSGFDSLTHPYTRFSGTYASRFAVMSLGAVKMAVEKVKEKILAIASRLLEANVQDLELRDKGVYVRGTDRGVPLTEVCRIAWRDVASLPPGMEPGLRAYATYTPKYDSPSPDGRGNFAYTYPVSLHIAAIEIDPETGQLKILKYVALDDPGVEINPLIVEGQVHGAWAHQLGAVLYESLTYDVSGPLLTSTFMDYLAPSAADLPGSDVVLFERHLTRSLTSTYGCRGVGEGGGCPIAAITNAVEDALGVDINESYVKPELIYWMLKKKKLS